MSLLTIKSVGDPVLRKNSSEVTEITQDLKQLAIDMLDTMYDAPGIGLAAPQVGKSVRLFVLDLTPEDIEEKKPLVFFNPVVIPESEPVEIEEGCLSIPGIYANVIRPEKITVKALDKNGTPFELTEIDGMLSRCIQHEVDHLDGILFIDKLSASDRALYESKLKKMVRETKAKAKK